jgi:hypothetical protein
MSTIDDNSDRNVTRDTPDGVVVTRKRSQT